MKMSGCICRIFLAVLLIGCAVSGGDASPALKRDSLHEWIVGNDGEFEGSPAFGNLAQEAVKQHALYRILTQVPVG